MDHHCWFCFKPLDPETGLITFCSYLCSERWEREGRNLECLDYPAEFDNYPDPDE